MNPMPTEPETEAKVPLLPCPFCGAAPHRGLTKTQHDQLHGEPFQNYRVWCPHGCASSLQPTEELSIAAWNRRTPTPAVGDVEMPKWFDEFVTEIKRLGLYALAWHNENWWATALLSMRGASAMRATGGLGK